MGKKASKDLKRLVCSVLLSEGRAFWKTCLAIVLMRKISCFPWPCFLKMNYFRSRSLENSDWGKDCFL